LRSIKEWPLFPDRLPLPANRKQEETMKEFHCGTLVPGCEWHTSASEEAEVVHRAVEHLRTVHGETIIRENMVDNIKKRIRDAAPAS
jgi:predicted small metal-binding protein